MPHASSTAPQPELSQVFAALQTHFLQIVVPIWLGPGWNPALALPFEAVDPAHQPLPAQRYRAMACARQLFVFASLIGNSQVPQAEQRAHALFRSLQRHFHDAEHGGWFYSIDPQGAPLDRRKDLYTHAFIIFACAHYWAKTREPLAESALDAALSVVREHFADSQGLYEASLGEDWSDLGSGALQNPLMHLAEAFLATLQVRADPDTVEALEGLVDHMHEHFIDPASGVLLEKPLGAVDNWYEPGHQFEWFFLLQSTPQLHGSPLYKALHKAFAVAQAQGVDARSGAVSAMLKPDGSIVDGTQRIWAQAEYLRALALRDGAQPLLAAQAMALQTRFIYPQGWHECLDSEGKVSRSDMPSTTPYHLATCYLGLENHLNNNT
ncbi:AGE family epimerase/isomerase [Pseudomonas sp. 21LCFQ02]|uniref:AGE family epimerase/isomerase n=1 Tax=Pseudomonas sp. 21LCFQ02 TaxID=2957505 RepID=UPI00209B7FF3|nr:AGE family epimerase/isomerase [Pseudomonas sp. 21LCFQ02]MCO8167798.1 AGE family epimerase/isomerase [Pseudomonas sp. 21LCFQ02]